MATTNSNFKVKNGLDAGGTITATGLSSAAGVALPISTANNTTASGAITIQTGTTSSGIGGITSGSVTIATGAGAGAGNGTGAILIQTGNGSGSTGPSGSVTIDTGTGSGTAAGTILIGTTNTSALTIGRTGITTTINGTLALPSQTANTFLASPNSAAGAPSFRVLSYRDIYPAGLPTTFGQVIEYAPVGGGMGWTSSAPLLKGGGTMTGAFVGATTTTSLAPIRLPSGTVPTTASQEFGMVAAAAESLQLSTTKTTGAGPGFGIVRAPQMVFSLANAPTSATTTTGVAAFAAANDVLSSLEANKLYRFRGKYYVTYTAGGTAGALQMLFAFANAPQAINYNFRTTKSTSATTMNQVGIAAVATGVSVSTSDLTSGTLTVEFDGYFTSNATTGGTLTPQIAASVASLSGGSFVVTTGSWFEVEKIGSATQTLIAGNWA